MTPSSHAPPPEDGPSESPPKFHIRIDRAEGVTIGDQASPKQTFKDSRTRSLWEELLSKIQKMRPRQIVVFLSLIVVLALVISILILKPSQEIASAVQTSTALALITATPSQTLTAIPSHTAIPTLPTDPPTATATQTPTPTATPTAALPSCVGRSPGNPESFSVYPDYDPSGHMGDIGDIVDVEKGAEGVHFTYEARGQGPHEWEWKYVGGELNPNPARFAGVIYLYPPNNLGQEPGFDLRAFRRAIVWEARSLTGEVNVEFVIGGINWVWDEAAKIKVSPPCRDSLRRKSLGIHPLQEQWQLFEVLLSDIPEEEFVNVIGGFAWVISWGSADIQPDQPRTFEIEIRNVRYQR